MAGETTPDPDGEVFEQVYAARRGQDPRSVPWSHGAPHPLFADWLDTAPNPAPGHDRALVVGSGLGDDAVALARAGWAVDAFDISPEAIAWARERFPDAPVRWRVASLFDLPDEWRQAFDLVVEIHTVQSLPPTRRQAAIRAIADTVAPGGALVVVAMTRHASVPLRGRPWPLTDAELAGFARAGLAEQDRQVVASPSAEHPGRVRGVWTRPVDR